ncbi:hypothetical protein B0T17DRAFT_67533 [Bombardia bombarda]|uniref:Uncharacterized protein n=1 Tax=Bombardia bombarda TaxID=252184 RepID=A0AA40CER3_9PEZI|nr:hypothetical protein B0T17DRAFT_67533 [Bombardia bombarda]
MADFKLPIEPYTAQRLVPYSRKWHITKIVLRSVSLVFAITLTSVAITSSQQPNFYDDTFYIYNGTTGSYESYSLGAGVLIRAWSASLPPGVVIALYDTGELITYCVRHKTQRGVHPTITLWVELVLWLGLLVCAVFNILLMSSVGAQLMTSYSARPTYFREIDIVAEVFLVILLSLHITLFVRAFKESKQRRQSKGPSFQYMYAPGGGRPFPVVINDDNNNITNASTGQQYQYQHQHQHQQYQHQPQYQQQHQDATQSEPDGDWGSVRPAVALSVAGVPPSSSIAAAAAAMMSTPVTVPVPAYRSVASTTAPPSLAGDGFYGYQGPTSADGHGMEDVHHHRGYGQKEIIPNRT